VSNIPAGMVADQFGMVGLLAFIRAAENDPNLVALAPGIDLTTLGLNLNSPELVLISSVFYVLAFTLYYGLTGLTPVNIIHIGICFYFVEAPT
jgi:hypothetical protein